MIQKMLSNEELLIVLGGQINFYGDQKAAAIDQITGREQWFGHIWCMVYVVRCVI
jgi:hypothetical protein